MSATQSRVDQLLAEIEKRKVRGPCADVVGASGAQYQYQTPPTTDATGATVAPSAEALANPSISQTAPGGQTAYESLRQFRQRSEAANNAAWRSPMSTGPATAVGGFNRQTLSRKTMAAQAEATKRYNTPAPVAGQTPYTEQLTKMANALRDAETQRDIDKASSIRKGETESKKELLDYQNKLPLTPSEQAKEDTRRQKITSDEAIATKRLEHQKVRDEREGKYREGLLAVQQTRATLQGQGQVDDATAKEFDRYENLYDTANKNLGQLYKELDDARSQLMNLHAQSGASDPKVKVGDSVNKLYEALVGNLQKRIDTENTSRDKYLKAMTAMLKKGPAKTAAETPGAAGPVPPPEQREVGKVYDLPKGKFVWNGQGWEAAE